MASSAPPVRDALTSDQIDRLRRGDDRLWTEIVRQYEGRLFAFAKSRVRDRSTAEDIVQETLTGLFTAIDRYDGRPLQKFLFGICSHKINDHFRRAMVRPQGRVAIGGGPPSSAEHDPVLAGPGPRTACFDQERVELEVAAVRAALARQIDAWREAGQWDKLKTVELLIVRGLPNKAVAALLDVSEQRVANVKFEFIQKLRGHVQGLKLPVAHFPELAEDGASE